MKFFIFFISFLCFYSLRGQETWVTSTPSYHDSLIRFQMPSTPSQTDENNLCIWKAESPENTYSVFATERRCTKNDNPLKPCDARSIFQYLIKEGFKLLSLKKDNNNLIHCSFAGGSHAYMHLSLCANRKIVIGMATQTKDLYSPEHLHFIQSFAFLE